MIPIVAGALGMVLKGLEKKLGKVNIRWLVLFYSISTLVGYLIAKSCLYVYIEYMICKQIVCNTNNSI